MRVEEIVEKLDGSGPFDVLAIFARRSALEEAARSLQSAGFESEEIKTYLNREHNFLDDKKASRLGEGLLGGVLIGIFLGALVGALFKMEMLHTIAPWLGVGANLIVGAVVGGMIGGPIGAIVGQTIPEYRVRKYYSPLSEGTILLFVDAKNATREQLAKEIIDVSGGKLTSKINFAT